MRSKLRTIGSTRMSAVTLVVGAGVVLSVLVIACSGSNDDGETIPNKVAVTSTTNPHRDTTTTSIPTPVEAVARAYQRATEADFAIEVSPSNADPRIPRNFTDPELTKFKAMVADMGRRAVVRNFPARSVYQLTIEGVDVKDPYNATVTACLVDDSITTQRSTGKVLSQGTKTLRLRAGMKQENDVWKISSRETVQTWNGLAGCAQPPSS